MSDVTPATATLGQAAYEGMCRHAIADDGPPGRSEAWEKLEPWQRTRWDAAADAANQAALPRVLAAAARYKAERDAAWAEVNRLGDLLAATSMAKCDAIEAADGWEGNFHAARKDADRYREELADAKALLEYWPLCPDGCGCRIGVTGPDGENDADRRDCACDGPCCMECRENGYPDAPSYRDLAVKHVMDDLAEASEIIEALREDHGRTDRYRQALQRIAMGTGIMSQAQASVIAAKALGTGSDPIAEAIPAERGRYRAALERVLRILRGEGTEAMDDGELAAVIAKALGSGDAQ